MSRWQLAPCAAEQLKVEAGLAHATRAVDEACSPNLLVVEGAITKCPPAWLDHAIPERFDSAHAVLCLEGVVSGRWGVYRGLVVATSCGSLPGTSSSHVSHLQRWGRSCFSQVKKCVTEGYEDCTC